MAGVFACIFLILGTVIGAGFSSGNEIVVFFSRFGAASYFYIIVASVLMFLAIYYFLRRGNKLVEVIEKSKILNFATIAISIVFGASMFAGTTNLFGFFDEKISIFLTVILLVLGFFVTAKGIGGLEKFNIIFTPIVLLLFGVVVIFACAKSGTTMQENFGLVGVLYCPLYVALNTSMSVFVLAKMGEKLSKKQALFSSLFSALVLLVFLVICNFALRKNAEFFSSNMPILSVVSGNKLMFFMEYLVIFVGCLTTLFSLLFTIKNSLKKYIKNDVFCNFLSIFLSFLISELGFSKIISYLYPICSVLSIFVVLFSIFSLKNADQIIHRKCKHTKNGC
jgi:uncharacterized membrane protein YkvI